MPTYPCWDGKGKYLYWLQDGTTLLKINREFKIEASVNLGNPCRYLAISSEGLITYSMNDSQVLVIDADTLKVRSKIPVQDVRWLGAGMGSSMAVVQNAQLNLVDLKSGKFINAPIGNAPQNFTGAEDLALRPTGKCSSCKLPIILIMVEWKPGQDGS